MSRDSAQQPLTSDLVVSGMILRFHHPSSAFPWSEELIDLLLLKILR